MVLLCTLCEHLEARLCLSGVSFAPHVIVGRGVDRPTSVHAADLDGDSGIEIVAAQSSEVR